MSMGREQFFRKLYLMVSKYLIKLCKKKKALNYVQKNANAKDWEGDCKIYEEPSLGLFCKYDWVLISLKKDNLDIKDNALWI